MERGNIVLLNGTSSAGKSTIAAALQAIMDEPYLHTGVDHFLSGLPASCFTISGGLHPAATNDFLLVFPGASTRRVDEHVDGEAAYGDGIFTGCRIGPRGRALLAGMYRGIAALAEAGVNVIVDDVIHDPRVLASAVTALRDSSVLFVGLHIPLEVAEQRERDRGDRGPGGAAAFYDLVHADGIYDLELDTSKANPRECAERIKAALDSGHPRQAIRTLAG